MKNLILIASLVFVFLPAASAQLPPEPTVPGITLNLWPDGKMPGHGATQPEMVKPATGDQVTRITNVSTPTLTVFLAPGTKGTTPAMVVCPGGAYGLLSYNLEGTEVAGWLNSLGITAAVLKYRVPGNRDGAFQDIQRAVRLVRQHAEEWKINPAHVGAIGFSAGGHLAARLSNNSAQPAYPPIDGADQLSCRPDFVVLVYPAYLEVKGQLAAEMTVTAQTPPTFIAHTEDDHKYVAGSKIYFAALQAAKAPSEFQLFPTGGHGYGLRCQKDAKVWPQRCQEWLHKNGIL